MKKIILNVFNINNIKYIKLNEILQICEELKHTKDIFDNNQDEYKILNNIYSYLNSLLRTNYYNMISPAKVCIINDMGVCYFCIEYINSQLYNDLLLLQNNKYKIGNVEVQSKIYSMFLINNINLYSSDCELLQSIKNNITNINQKIEQLENELDRIKIITNNRDVFYNYEKIKQEKIKLNTEFKRIFKLLHKDYNE